MTSDDIQLIAEQFGRMIELLERIDARLEHIDAGTTVMGFAHAVNSHSVTRKEAQAVRMKALEKLTGFHVPNPPSLPKATRQAIQNEAAREAEAVGVG